MIPYKKYLQLKDMEISARENLSYAEVELFMNSIGWPWKASQEQIDDWNKWMEVYCQ